MSSAALVWAGARHYWRTHLGIIAGAALATLVLTGSLLVGDSVRGTLRAQAAARVGKAEVALTGGDEFFRSALADEIGGGAAPLLLLRASASLPDGSARINDAQMLGVDRRFWAMGLVEAGELPEQGVALNERAATQLGASVGSTVILRMEKPGLFSKDAPLSGEENEVVAIRAQVAQIVDDGRFGRFSLQAGQTPPATVFAPLAFLQQRLAFPGRANLLLAPHVAGQSAQTALAALRGQFVERAKVEDFGLELRRIKETGELELRSPRVFLDAALVAALPTGTQALTYLVNELRAGPRGTPYSMVTAVAPAASGFLPPHLAAGEIAINQWLADDLQVAVGGSVALKYFVMGERRQLTEQTRAFTVAAILPMTGPEMNGSWMPDFPGLADKKNCRDWQPGFQMDTTKIRPQDEAYWQEHRGTPKAFVSLAAGQQMWSNRWGAVTSIRYAGGANEDTLRAELRQRVTPELAGLRFIPLREEALAATKAPVDFGELFVSFSFFLILAAAVLTGLLFVFALEQRNAEAGLLLALGLRPRQVRRLFFAEGAVLAMLGAAVGICGAIAYTQVVLHALAGIWSGAVGGAALRFAADPSTLPTGFCCGVLVALAAMWLASRRQLRRSARDLLAGGLEPSDALRVGWFARLWSRIAPAVAPICLVAALALLFVAKGAEAFFSAGSLLLLAGFAAAWQGLRHLGNARGGLPSASALGVRNAARSRGRSLAVIAVLASGVFIVVAVSSFRHAPAGAQAAQDPGTGGFALVGESALPIYEDLMAAKGREAYGLDEKIMAGVSIVPCRVRDGDEASCLNLNRALQPRLLGVAPGELQSRGAFVRNPKEDPWKRLAQGPGAGGAAPGVADAATLEWSLQKQIGDTVEYPDERGQTMKVLLAGAVSGTILQGVILIPEREFVAHFPSAGGYRYFLIDCPPTRVKAVREHLSRQLSDRGLALVTTAERLGDFQAVENTYLSIFQALGGLGLLLGSVGLAIVVGRHVLERRRELGLLEAVGFPPAEVRRLLLVEHAGLIVAALLIGGLSALLAVWPNLGERTGGFPTGPMALLFAALLAGSLFWTWLAARLALRSAGVAALRTE